MAHECPECGHICYCNGDIDDCDCGDADATANCMHCDEDAVWREDD